MSFKAIDSAGDPSGLDHGLGFIVVHFSVRRVYLRRFARKRRIDEQLHFARHFALLAQLVQKPDDLLRAPHGKGWDQQLGVVPVDVLEISFEPEFHVVGRGVVPVGIGGFNQQNVGACGILVVADDRLVRLSEVSGEEKPVALAPVLPDVELHQGRTENMPGVEKLERYPFGDLPGFVHVQGREKLHQHIDVAFIVQRLEQGLALLRAPLVDVFKVALLQETGVSQHHVAEIRRGMAREHATAESLSDELRKVARMVDMGVGKDHVVDGLRIDGKLSVLLESLFAVPLVEAALEEYALAVRLDEVHRAGRSAGSSVECDFHVTSLRTVSAASSG